MKGCWIAWRSVQRSAGSYCSSNKTAEDYHTHARPRPRTHAHAHTHVHTHAYTHTHAHIHTCDRLTLGLTRSPRGWTRYLCVSVRVSVRVYLCGLTRECVCACAWVRACACERVLCVHAHTRACARVYVRARVFLPGYCSSRYRIDPAATVPRQIHVRARRNRVNQIPVNPLVNHIPGG